MFVPSLSAEAERKRHKPSQIPRNLLCYIFVIAGSSRHCEMMRCPYGWEGMGSIDDPVGEGGVSSCSEAATTLEVTYRPD